MIVGCPGPVPRTYPSFIIFAVNRQKRDGGGQLATGGKRIAECEAQSQGAQPGGTLYNDDQIIFVVKGSGGEPS
jgi:hypothetical protein